MAWGGEKVVGWGSAPRSSGYGNTSASVIIGAKKSHISNIENDKSSLSFEKLFQIITKYKIDARYFFGQIDSPEEADLSKRGEDLQTSPIERLEKKLDRVTEKIVPITRLDPVAEKVMLKPELHDLVEMIWTWDAEQLRRFSDVAFGWIARGSRDRSDQGTRKTGT
jgi:transcriptional regulator with XRE-family HTH domain